VRKIFVTSRGNPASALAFVFTFLYSTVPYCAECRECTIANKYQERGVMMLEQKPWYENVLREIENAAILNGTSETISLLLERLCVVLVGSKISDTEEVVTGVESRLREISSSHFEKGTCGKEVRNYLDWHADILCCNFLVSKVNFFVTTGAETIIFHMKDGCTVEMKVADMVFQNYHGCETTDPGGEYVNFYDVKNVTARK